ncbi:RloB family protein [Halobacteriovorax sp. FRX-2]
MSYRKRSNPKTIRKSSRLVIVVEGETEYDYLDRLRLALGIAEPIVTIKKAPGGDLLTCVKELEREIEKQRKEDIFNEVAGDKGFVVCDGDEHLVGEDGKYCQSLIENANTGFQIINSCDFYEFAISNPTFDYWLYLHFKNEVPPMDQGQVLQKLRMIPGFENFNKRITKEMFEILLPKIDEAASRAKAIFEDKLAVAENPVFWLQENPYTKMYELVCTLNKIAERNSRE